MLLMQRIDISFRSYVGDPKWDRSFSLFSHSISNSAIESWEDTNQ